MTVPLFRVVVDRGVGSEPRVVTIASTDRTDGDVHPERVEPSVLRSRQRAATGATWTMLDEIHSTTVVDVSTARRDGENPVTIGTGDVLVSSGSAAPRDADDGAHLAVWTADCAPLILVASDATIVAAHAGWRGIASGVVQVAVDAARRHGGDVVAAVLGPLIHPCCYEFGVDDLFTVPHAVPGRTSTGALALDVPATIAKHLAVQGIVLDVTGPCTGCDDRWFSHRVRRDPGRHATVVW